MRQGKEIDLPLSSRIKILCRSLWVILTENYFEWNKTVSFFDKPILQRSIKRTIRIDVIADIEFRLLHLMQY